MPLFFHVIFSEMHKPSTVQKCDKIVSKLDHSSQDKRHKKVQFTSITLPEHFISNREHVNADFMNGYTVYTNIVCSVKYG